MSVQHIKYSVGLKADNPACFLTTRKTGESVYASITNNVLKFYLPQNYDYVGEGDYVEFDDGDKVLLLEYFGNDMWHVSDLHCLSVPNKAKTIVVGINKCFGGLIDALDNIKTLDYLDTDDFVDANISVEIICYTMNEVIDGIVIGAGVPPIPYFNGDENHRLIIRSHEKHRYKSYNNPGYNIYLTDDFAIQTSYVTVNGLYIHSEEEYEVGLVVKTTSNNVLIIGNFVENPGNGIENYGNNNVIAYNYIVNMDEEKCQANIVVGADVESFTIVNNTMYSVMDNIKISLGPIESDAYKIENNVLHCENDLMYAVYNETENDITISNCIYNGLVSTHVITSSCYALTPFYRDKDIGVYTLLENISHRFNGLTQNVATKDFWGNKLTYTTFIGAELCKMNIPVCVDSDKSNYFEPINEFMRPVVKRNKDDSTLTLTHSRTIIPDSKIMAGCVITTSHAIHPEIEHEYLILEVISKTKLRVMEMFDHYEYLKTDDDDFNEFIDFVRTFHVMTDLNDAEPLTEYVCEKLFGNDTYQDLVDQKTNLFYVFRDINAPSYDRSYDIYGYSTDENFKLTVTGNYQYYSGEYMGIGLCNRNNNTSKIVVSSTPYFLNPRINDISFKNFEVSGHDENSKGFLRLKDINLQRIELSDIYADIPGDFIDYERRLNSHSLSISNCKVENAGTAIIIKDNKYDAYNEESMSDVFFVPNFSFSFKAPLIQIYHYPNDNLFDLNNKPVLNWAEQGALILSYPSGINADVFFASAKVIGTPFGEIVDYVANPLPTSFTFSETQGDIISKDNLIVIENFEASNCNVGMKIYKENSNIILEKCCCYFNKTKDFDINNPMVMIDCCSGDDTLKHLGQHQLIQHFFKPNNDGYDIIKVSIGSQGQVSISGIAVDDTVFLPGENNSIAVGDVITIDTDTYIVSEYIGNKIIKITDMEGIKPVDLAYAGVLDFNRGLENFSSPSSVVSDIRLCKIKKKVQFLVQLIDGDKFDTVTIDGTVFDTYPYYYGDGVVEAWHETSYPKPDMVTIKCPNENENLFDIYHYGDYQNDGLNAFYSELSNCLEIKINYVTVSGLMFKAPAGVCIKLFNVNNCKIFHNIFIDSSTCIEEFWHAEDERNSIYYNLLVNFSAFGMIVKSRSIFNNTLYTEQNGVVGISMLEDQSATDPIKNNAVDVGALSNIPYLPEYVENVIAADHCLFSNEDPTYNYSEDYLYLFGGIDFIGLGKFDFQMQGMGIENAYEDIFLKLVRHTCIGCFNREVSQRQVYFSVGPIPNIATGIEIEISHSIITFPEKIPELISGCKLVFEAATYYLHEKIDDLNWCVVDRYGYNVTDNGMFTIDVCHCYPHINDAVTDIESVLTHKCLSGNKIIINISIAYNAENIVINWVDIPFFFTNEHGYIKIIGALDIRKNCVEDQSFFGAGTHIIDYYIKALSDIVIQNCVLSHSVVPKIFELMGDVGFIELVGCKIDLDDNIVDVSTFELSKLILRNCYCYCNENDFGHASILSLYLYNNSIEAASDIIGVTDAVNNIFKSCVISDLTGFHDNVMDSQASTFVDNKRNSNLTLSITDDISAGYPSTIDDIRCFAYRDGMTYTDDASGRTRDRLWDFGWLEKNVAHTCISVGELDMVPVQLQANVYKDIKDRTIIEFYGEGLSNYTDYFYVGVLVYVDSAPGANLHLIEKIHENKFYCEALDDDYFGINVSQLTNDYEHLSEVIAKLNSLPVDDGDRYSLVEADTRLLVACSRFIDSDSYFLIYDIACDCDRFIKIFTPDDLAKETNVSQRHLGLNGNGYNRIISGVDIRSIICSYTDYIEIEGLQLEREIESADPILHLIYARQFSVSKNIIVGGGIDINTVVLFSSINNNLIRNCVNAINVHNLSGSNVGLATYYYRLLTYNLYGPVYFFLEVINNTFDQNDFALKIICTQSVINETTLADGTGYFMDYVLNFSLNIIQNCGQDFLINNKVLHNNFLYTKNISYKDNALGLYNFFSRVLFSGIEYDLNPRDAVALALRSKPEIYSDVDKDLKSRGRSFWNSGAKELDRKTFEITGKLAFLTISGHLNLVSLIDVTIHLRKDYDPGISQYQFLKFEEDLSPDPDNINYFLNQHFFNEVTILCQGNCQFDGNLYLHKCNRVIIKTYYKELDQGVAAIKFIGKFNYDENLILDRIILREIKLIHTHDSMEVMFSDFTKKTDIYFINVQAKITTATTGENLIADSEYVNIKAYNSTFIFRLFSPYPTVIYLVNSTYFESDMVNCIVICSNANTVFALHDGNSGRSIMNCMFQNFVPTTPNYYIVGDPKFTQSFDFYDDQLPNLIPAKDSPVIDKGLNSIFENVGGILYVPYDSQKYPRIGFTGIVDIGPYENPYAMIIFNSNDLRQIFQSHMDYDSATEMHSDEFEYKTMDREITREFCDESKIVFDISHYRYRRLETDKKSYLIYSLEAVLDSYHKHIIAKKINSYLNRILNDVGKYIFVYYDGTLYVYLNYIYKIE